MPRARPAARHAAGVLAGTRNRLPLESVSATFPSEAPCGAFPMDIEAAKSDILATEDLLERALKLSGLVTALFAEQGFRLVVVGGSAVEFYTEGGYMSGDIDFCRFLSRPIPPRLAQDVMAKLGATGGPRSWRVLGLFVDMLGYLENESTSPKRKLETPYGPIERLADLRDFGVLREFRAMKREVEGGKA